MRGFGFGGGGCRGHNGFDDTKGGGLLSLGGGVLYVICFKLTGETPIQSGVGLRLWRISLVSKTIQEVGRRNRPPCLRNRIFPKLSHTLLGVVFVMYPVSLSF